MSALSSAPRLGPPGPLAPGRSRIRAQILAARQARGVAESSRLRAIASLHSERLSSPAYRERAAAIFPIRQPLLDGKPWVGDVGRLVADEAHDAQFALAMGTVTSQALFVRRAMTWMQAQWLLQLTRRPFTLTVVAKHPDLLLAYLRHLADTSTHKQLHKHIKDVRSAMNGLLHRSGFPKVANLPAMQKLSARLSKSHSPAVKKTKAFTPKQTIAISMQWGFGYCQDLSPACSGSLSVGLRYWCKTPYRLWVALAVRLGMETLTRFDDLSYITARSIRFARDAADGTRALSMCFTHRKQNQANTPVWVHVPDSGSPYCAYRLMAHALGSQCGIVPDLNAPLWFFPAAPAAAGLGSGKGFLFPRFLSSPGAFCSRWNYDPVMSWASRAPTAAYCAQIQNAVVEVFGLARDLADAYGTRSMRAGGNTALLAANVGASERRDIGFWASEECERLYLRISAVGRARSLLRRGITFL